MNKEKPTLDDLRREIDQIDDGLHDLLIRRAEISMQIAKIKRGEAGGGTARHASAFRPAREATILRRLLAHHKGGLPPRVIVHIWREIMAASLRVQGDFHIHVFAGDKASYTAGLAHDHFGSLSTLRSHGRVSSVVQACIEDPGAIGLLPLPEAERGGKAWWAQLAAEGEAGPRIIAKLPFLVENEDAPVAYVIGWAALEPTGDDSSLLLLEVAAGLSRGKISSLLKESGLEARLVTAGRLEDVHGPDDFLFEVAGFAGEDDERLKALAQAAGESVLRLALVGAFANPIQMAAGENV